jgi:hypothetical protein
VCISGKPDRGPAGVLSIIYPLKGRLSREIFSLSQKNIMDVYKSETQKSKKSFQLYRCMIDRYDRMKEDFEA